MALRVQAHEKGTIHGKWQLNQRWTHHHRVQHDRFGRGKEKDQFSRKDFIRSVIFRVGPTDNATNALMPDTTLDGVQGAGNLGGSGLVGIGGEYISDQSSGVGVLGFGGPPSRLSQVSNPAGVGVKGIAGGAADGVSARPMPHPKAASSVSIPCLRRRLTLLGMAFSVAATRLAAPGLKRNRATVSGSGDIAD